MTNEQPRLSWEDVMRQAARLREAEEEYSRAMAEAARNVTEYCIVMFVPFNYEKLKRKQRYLRRYQRRGARMRNARNRKDKKG
jgi:hypothetical protein